MRPLPPCPTRLVLILDEVPLALWVVLDPAGRAPMAARFDAAADEPLAYVPVVRDDRRLSATRREYRSSD